MRTERKFFSDQKKILLAEKEKIEQKIAKLKKFPKYGTDEEDNLQEMEDYGNNLSIEGQLEFLSKKITKALKAIEKGTYGKCNVCRENIERGRLKIMPYAEVCVTCKKNGQKK